MTGASGFIDQAAAQTTRDAADATNQLALAQAKLASELGRIDPMLGGLGTSMLGLKVAAVGLLAVVGFKMVKALFESGREARSLATQYVLMGLSVDETRRRMERLQAVGGRGLIKTMGDLSDESQELFEVLGTDALAGISALADELADLSSEYESGQEVIDQVYTPAVKKGMDATGNLEQSQEGATRTLMGMIEAAKQADPAMSDWQQSVNDTKDAWAAFTEAFAPAGTTIKDALVFIGMAILEQVQQWIAWWTKFFEDMRTLWNWFSEAYNSFKEWSETVSALVDEWVADTWDAFSGWVADTAKAILQWAVETGKSFLDWTVETLKNIGTFFVDLYDMFRDRLGTLATDSFRWGVNIMQGLWDGLKSVAGRVQQWVTDFVQRMIDRIQSVLRMGSPSRVMMDIGQNMMEGMRLGMEQGFGRLESEFPSMLSGGSRQTIHVHNYLDGREIGGTSLDVIDGQVRRRIPNLGLP